MQQIAEMFSRAPLDPETRKSEWAFSNGFGTNPNPWCTIPTTEY